MMAKINEKMQPNIRQEHRRWQIDPTHQYGFGECPQCGGSGESVGEWSNGDGTDSEEFLCRECKIEYTYETKYAYRFLDINDDQETLRYRMD
jgi:hypothetical protein